MWAGMCTWPQLSDITLVELIEMHRSLNLKGFLEAEEHEIQKARQGEK